MGRDPNLRNNADWLTASELGLASGEALGLAEVPRCQVEQFANSLHRKRRDQVRRVVPIAARALGRRFAALFNRYVQESPPRGSKADLDDAAGFVAAIRRWANQIQPEWAVDLARCEVRPHKRLCGQSD